MRNARGAAPLVTFPFFGDHLSALYQTGTLRPSLVQGTVAFGVDHARPANPRPKDGERPGTEHVTFFVEKGPGHGVGGPVILSVLRIVVGCYGFKSATGIKLAAVD